MLVVKKCRSSVADLSGIFNDSPASRFGLSKNFAPLCPLFAGNDVILNTPTGSGKSLVALALQFKSPCQGRRSYYSDHSRGAAWQIPLLTLPRARFFLMSATLGDFSFFPSNSPRSQTRPTTLVQSDQRSVPLEFEYSTTQLQEKVAELNEQGRSPVYLVHFTQNACADTARDLLSTNFCTKEEKPPSPAEVTSLKNRLHLSCWCVKLSS